ncbi:MAG: PAS domain S-box protein [Desulfobacterales bacterium]|nr:PAS domain S-box protein [Desulfobacterales bacterium]
MSPRIHGPGPESDPRQTSQSTDDAVADNASIALDNVDLYDRFQRELDARKEVQVALERRVRLERIINQFSLDLIQAEGTDLDRAIEKGMATIGSFSGVDRAYLFLFSNDATRMTNTHEWCAPGIIPQKNRLQNLSADLFPWWVARLRDRKVIHIPTVAALPPEADAEREILAVQGIRSVLVVPLSSEKRIEGFVGFDAVSREQAWSEEDIGGLSTAANLIASVIARSRSERERKRSERRYRELFDSINDLIYTHDMNGRFTTVNPAMTKAFGYDAVELLGRPVVDFMAEKHRPRFGPEYLDRLQQNGSAEGVSLYFTKDGRKIHVEYQSTLVRSESGEDFISGIGRDISERIQADGKIQQLQAEMLQAQKMEAIGTLAGGIAHDFNNLMMGIQGRISLIQMEDGKSAACGAHLKEMEACVQSAVDLTRQLLGFARGGRYEVRSADLNRLVKIGTEIFGRTRKEIAIQLDLSVDLWPAAVDSGQIEQVLLNLYVNAWQSMPGGGKLLVATENVTVAETDLVVPGLKPGNHVRITVTDTGVGMDESTRNRLFEPFFTTREMGRGTGLGLASAYGIVKHHGGIIHVDSVKGRGSVFSVYLPAHAVPVRASVPPPDKIVRGKGLVLLVDDEELILDVGEQMVRALGYEVITASGGQEALRRFEAEKGKIDLVILDMIMPQMSGEETFDRLKAMDPSFSVLLSSGYSVDGKAQEILDRGCRGFLQKPFSLKALSAKIEEAMGESGTRTGG